VGLSLHRVENFGVPFGQVHEQIVLVPAAGCHVVRNNTRKALFVLSGECRHVLPDWAGPWGEVVLRPGAVLLLPHRCRQEYHPIRPGEPARVHVVRLALDERLLPPLPFTGRADAGAPPLPPDADPTRLADACFRAVEFFRPEADSRLGETLNELREEARRQLPAYRARVYALSLSLLALLARRLGPARPGGEDAPAPGTVAAVFHVSQAKEYLRSRLDRPVRLAEVARHVGVTEEHLARLFRQEAGVTVGEYLRRLRVEQARNYLTTTERNLGEIARQVGFSSLTVFTRNFRRETGLTPTEFRRQVAGQIG
jgi:AraC-like DNA-binding protein